ncbi:DddA-like double-stranded DNA deaminase toxin [Actinokineospora spheciospongiae]|uniref:DddA-like double-stranded DNA deaminase toxin n=1 Tax=Actinokineospora spheciospongiae TaxID=909613 RepID=UPI003986E63D
MNHAPCGSEQGFPQGCHDYLPDFLPTEHTLTVLGTDARGNPFKWTYEGKAPL